MNSYSLVDVDTEIEPGHENKSCPFYQGLGIGLYFSISKQRQFVTLVKKEVSFKVSNNA